MSKVEIYDYVDGEQLERFLALQRNVQNELRQWGWKMFHTAKDIHAAHINEGHSFISWEHGDIDYHVTLNDERGDRAAAAIENEINALRRSLWGR